MRVCVCACVRACVRVCVCVCACVCACVRACTRACVHACVRACLRTCVCLSVCLYVFQVSLLQDSIYSLGKGHKITSYIPSLRRFPKVAFEPDTNLRAVNNGPLS